MEYIVSLGFFILNYKYIFMKFYDFVYFISVYVSKVHLTFLKDMQIICMYQTGLLNNFFQTGLLLCALYSFIMDMESFQPQSAELRKYTCRVAGVKVLVVDPN
jgi:hypothetical protein